MRIEILTAEESRVVKSAIDYSVIYLQRDRDNYIGEMSNSLKKIYADLISEREAIRYKLVGDYRIVIEYHDENPD